MHLVFNERAKHTASWFNIATSLIAADAFAPIAALYGLSTPGAGSAYLLALVIGCVVVGLSIHLCGWACLGD